MTRSSPPGLGQFSTGVVLACVGFMLGTAFMALVPEHRILFVSGAKQADYLKAEQYYLTLWTSPLAVKALFHVMLVAPLFALSFKIAAYTEAALLFDGLSALSMLGVIALYTTSTVPNLRLLASTPSTEALRALVASYPSSSGSPSSPTSFDPSSPQAFLTRILRLLSTPSLVMSKSKAIEVAEAFAKDLEENPVTDARRRELIAVTAAAHSMAAILLIGVLLLQAGRAYAEREDAKTKARFEREEAEAAPAPVSAEKKTQ